MTAKNGSGDLSRKALGINAHLCCGHTPIAYGAFQLGGENCYGMCFDLIHVKSALDCIEVH